MVRQDASSRTSRAASSSDVSPAKLLRSILWRWDKGGKKTRLHILRDFILECQSFTGPGLDKNFNNGASLLLTRISTWLRMCYSVDGVKGMDLVLRSIRVFVGAASGQRFLKEFCDVGNVAAVIDVLTIVSLDDQVKVEALELLVSIANGGREYKELLCDLNCIEVVSMTILYSDEKVIRKFALLLLTLLGQGNPNFIHRVLNGLSFIISHKVDMAYDCANEQTYDNSKIPTSPPPGRQTRRELTNLSALSHYRDKKDIYGDGSDSTDTKLDLELQLTMWRKSNVILLFRQTCQVLRQLLLENTEMLSYLHSSCIAKIVEAGLTMLKCNDHEVNFEANQLFMEVHVVGSAGLLFYNSNTESDNISSVVYNEENDSGTNNNNSYYYNMNHTHIEEYVINELKDALVHPSIIKLAYDDRDIRTHSRPSPSRQSGANENSFVEENTERVEKELFQLMHIDSPPAVSPLDSSTQRQFNTSTPNSNHPLIIQQANVARVIGNIVRKHLKLRAESTKKGEKEAVETQSFIDDDDIPVRSYFKDATLVSNLIVCCGNPISSECQKQGSLALHALLTLMPDEIKSTIKIILNGNSIGGQFDRNNTANSEAFYRHIALNEVNLLDDMDGEVLLSLNKCIDRRIEEIKENINSTVFYNDYTP